MGKKKGDPQNVTSHIVNSAVETGIDYITKQNPRLNRESLLENINQNALYREAERIIQSPEFGQIQDGQEKSQYLHQNLVSFIGEGGAFSSALRDALGGLVERRKGLEDRADHWYGFKARKNLGQEKDRDNTYLAAREILGTMGPEESRMMPDLAKAAYAVTAAGANESYIQIARNRGILGEKDYDAAMKATGETIDSGKEAIAVNVVKYSGAQTERIAATVLGGLGLVFVIASGIGITGNVIGTGDNTTGGLLGAFLLIMGLIVFLTRRK